MDELTFRIGRTNLAEKGPNAKPEAVEAFESYIDFVKKGLLPDTSIVAYRGNSFVRVMKASEYGIRK